MATTESRTGFRLPWSADRQDGDAANESESTGAESKGEATDNAWPAADRAATSENHVTPESAPAAPSAPVAPAKKPSKFMADLTRAMQAAAESAREATLTQFQADAKTYVEQIHDRSAGEATQLRQHADDDVAGIREWSKAEIARIREETEQKITDRKARLEQEVDDHAALIERQIERIQGRVGEFESEMDRFFERLLGETDPTRFAAMAENLPEPPEFDETFLAGAGLVAAPPVAPVVETAPEADPASTSEPTGAEAAFAAIQPAAEAAEPADDGTEGADDPRIAALGLTPDFAAAEAEAFAAADASSDEDIPEIADDVVSERLANLIPDGTSAESAPAASNEATTQVVVVGLVSVAAIASFKRHLGRVPGVSSVGVSSGPDGEFVFTVRHAESVVLAEVAPTLPGFKARVTSVTDGAVNVTASDPESEG